MLGPAIPIEAWWVRTFRAYTTAINVGDFVMVDTGNTYKVVPLSATASNAVFCGISLTKILATEQNGSPVQVLMKGLIKCPLTAAAYTIGNGLKAVIVSSKVSALVADGDVDTIAWFAGDDAGSSNISTGVVLIDIPLLCSGSADDLFHVVSA